MKLSYEQKEIIQASKKLKKGETMKIDACAGSGKTSTLIEIAKANPNIHYLYLAFNKNIASKATTIFPNNCTAMTIHSLAYRNIFKINHYVLGNIKPKDLKIIFPRLNFYQLFELFSEYKSFLNSNSQTTNDSIKKIFKAVEKGKIPCIHDHYLKTFEMSDSYINNLENEYDCIFLDESQDANPVMLSILNKTNCSKIFVGDTHQSIYGFRGAINALMTQKASITKNLSISFRSTQNILDKANFYIDFFQKQIYNDALSYIPMKSFSEKISVQSEQKAIITRTNAMLVEVIHDNMDNPENVYLQKKANDVFKMPIALYEFLYKNKRNFWGDLMFLNDFDDIDELEEYARIMNDIEILSSIPLAQKYQKSLYYIKEQAEKMNNIKAPLVLTNAHVSKGLEWKEVTLMSDFYDLGEVYAYCFLNVDNEYKSMNFVEKQSSQYFNFIQELNLYYVAITRAQLKVNDLTPNAKFTSIEQLNQHIDLCIKKEKKRRLDAELSQKSKKK